MNENVKLWIEALRSGEYEQTTTQLGAPEIGFCCLGVACQVYEKVTHDILPKDNNEYYIDDVGKQQTELESYCSVVAQWLSITEEDQREFMCMNDSRGLSFVQIADEIEKRYNQFEEK